MNQFIFYAVLKLVAHAFWGIAGVRLLDRGRPRTVAVGIMWGTMRTLLGVITGLIVYACVHNATYAFRTEPSTYLGIYVPLRFFEWFLMAKLVRQEGKFSTRDLLWIGGGVIISFLADIPMMHHGVVQAGRAL